MSNMLKNITTNLVAASLLLFCCNNPPKKLHQDQEKTELPKRSEDSMQISALPDDLVEIMMNDSTILDRMAYADTFNFTHKKIYPCSKCLLRMPVARALLKADSIARTLKLHLVIFDCYRPKTYQRRMFDIVHDPKYVADTIKGSNHNKACAVDISLADANGKLLDMGSDFDEFSERSHLDFKGLSKVEIDNRTMLKNMMQQAGFETYKFEWWHFNYKNINYPVSNYLWSCD